MKKTISVLVENRAGVLSRIAGLFSRRGFNAISRWLKVPDILLLKEIYSISSPFLK